MLLYPCQTFDLKIRLKKCNYQSEQRTVTQRPRAQGLCEEDWGLSSNGSGKKDQRGIGYYYTDSKKSLKSSKITWETFKKPI